jgi:hypothetical protein
MADESQTSADRQGGNGFFKELSRSAVKRALAPLAATAATAGTAYLTRKATQIWHETVVPKVRDKGGGRAFTKDALEQAARKLPGGRGSGLLRDLARRFDERSAPSESAASQTPRSGTQAAESAAADPRREQERRERQRRREQRQRALEQSRST